MSESHANRFPFLLLPGFMADAALWMEVAPALQSSGPITYGDLNEGDSLEAIAQQILARAPARFILVGFSMGGYVARTIARIAPERVPALILVASSSRPDTPQQMKSKAAAIKAIPAGPFRGLSMAAIKASVHPNRAGDTELLSRIREMGIRLGTDVFISQSSVVRPHPSGELAKIACPTLVIAADADQLRSLDEARELEAGIPKATLVVIPNSGHMVPMEQPELLGNAIRQWLREMGLAP